MMAKCIPSLSHFAEKQNHINGIENFWNQTKRHLHKLNGIPKAHFELYLKECEWCFNHSNLKSQILMLKQLVKSRLSSLSRTVPFQYSAVCQNGCPTVGVLAWACSRGKIGSA